MVKCSQYPKHLKNLSLETKDYIQYEYTVVGEYVAVVTVISDSKTISEKVILCACPQKQQMTGAYVLCIN